MDVYSQLQEKLDDISQRFAHEARYFQVCAPPRAEGAEKVHDPLEEPPFPETAESLAQRAQLSAHAIVALNVQVEQLLGMLPSEEGGEEAQMKELEALVRENEEAGAAVRRERERVEEVLGKVRGVMGDVCEKGANEIPEEWLALAAAQEQEQAAEGDGGGAGPVRVKEENLDGEGGAGAAGGQAGGGGGGAGVLDAMEVDDGEAAGAEKGGGAGAVSARAADVKEEEEDVKEEVVDVTGDAPPDVKVEDQDSLLLP